MSQVGPIHRAAPLSPAHVVGVLSDTHGLLRPEVLEILQGSELIIHAGDIGSEEVLRVLGDIAPVEAVKGNTDRSKWALSLPKTRAVRINEALLYVIHDLHELDLDPRGGFDAVISGHSHRPSRQRREGVLYLNPGSAGPRRFKLPISIGRLLVRGKSLEAELIELEG